MTKVLLQLLLTSIIFSCGNKQENKVNQNFSSNAVGTIIHSDSFTAPIRIKVTVAPVQIKAGEPELIQNPFGNGLGAPNFTNYGTEDGLPISALNCCISDKMGRIWTSSSGGGISCFDGKKFTNYSNANGLSASNCWEMVQDRKDNIWITTWGEGVNIFNGTEFKSLSTKDGLASNRIFCILEDKDGAIWLGSDDAGISIYKDGKITSYNIEDGLPSNKITDIALAKNGQIWIATTGGGASMFDGKTFRNYAIEDGLPSININNIAIDSVGRIWFGTDGAGLACFDGKTFKTFTTKDGIAENIIRSIMVDKDNNIWFGTEHNGVSYFDGKTFTTYNKSHGLGENSIGYSCMGKNGTIWFATYGGGLSCYKGNAITQLQSSAAGSVNMIFNVTETHSGKIILGKYGNGFSLFDGKSFRNYSSKQGLPNERIYSIVEDKNGNFWLGSEGGGLIKFDGEYLTQYTTKNGLVGDKIRILTFDSLGNLWIGTDGSGISRFDGNEFTNYTTKQGLGSNTVWSLHCDKSGKIWVGTMYGLSMFNGKEFTNYTTQDGLCGNAIGHISQDHIGNLWIGSIGNGASKFDGKKFTNYNTSNGLADDLVYSIIDDVKNNVIWFGTNLGLSGLSKNSDENHWIYFNNSTGYPLKDFNSNAMMLDSKGILWGGMGDGKLMRFDYTASKIKKEPIKLTIQEIKINHEQICWHTLDKSNQKNGNDSSNFSQPELNEMLITFGKVLNKGQLKKMKNRFGKISFDAIEKFNSIPTNLVLPYENNNITFEFGAIDPSLFPQIKYQYMMLGYDKSWSPLSSLTSANFGNIDEGQYTFKLRSYYGPKDFSEVEYSLSVSPPLYRTWWAYLIYIASFLLALRLFSKWRERSLRLEKEKLENMVVDRTAVVEKQKEELVQKNIIVEKEKQRSDELLLNILPEEVAEELKAKGSAEAKLFDEVTVLFTDFKDFTSLSEKMTAKELVEEIHTCFMAFDHIIEKHGIEKIKTIGDSYMCAGGLPVSNTTHAIDVIKAGLEIQDFIKDRITERIRSGKEPFEIRIGIHSGPVVAGIVGIKKFAYDIWGDTVNTASRMESNGEVGKVNISGSTYELIKDSFNCTYRGKVETKGKGKLDMYFVERL